MNKKVIAFALALVVFCAVFAGCKKKAAEKVAVSVTDEKGNVVTDKDGKAVTELVVPETDEDGNNVFEKVTGKNGQILLDKKGKEITQVIPEGKQQEGSEQEVDTSSGKVPYSTTAPNATRGIDEWTFGDMATVGCYAPNGWTSETVNQLVKNGSETRVVINPMNYKKGEGYKNAEQYAKFIMEASYGKDSGAKQLSYAKEVYSDGMGIAMLYKAKSASNDGAGHTIGKYQMTYIFQTGSDVRVYFVYGESEAQAKTSIADIIANTYYRG